MWFSRLVPSGRDLHRYAERHRKHGREAASPDGRREGGRPLRGTAALVQRLRRSVGAALREDPSRAGRHQVWRLVDATDSSK